MGAHRIPPHHLRRAGLGVALGALLAAGIVDAQPTAPTAPAADLSSAWLHALVPMLRATARLPEYHPHIVRAPLARRVVSTTGRHQFYTVRIIDGQAHPAFKASGDITSMAHADGYIEIPAQTDIVEAGEQVDVKLF